jgi:FtsZ-interacting cell division protein YlmF
LRVDEDIFIFTPSRYKVSVLKKISNLLVY